MTAPAILPFYLPRTPAAAVALVPASPAPLLQRPQVRRESGFVPVRAIPSELKEALSMHAQARAAFAGLEDADRRSYIEYVEAAHAPEIRERRAALVALKVAALFG